MANISEFELILIFLKDEILVFISSDWAFKRFPVRKDG